MPRHDGRHSRYYVFTKAFRDDIARILAYAKDIERDQELEIRMAGQEAQKMEELAQTLASISNEVQSVETVIDSLVAAVQNAGDVSPQIQAALDTALAYKARLAAAALKGTPSDPNPEEPLPPVEPV
jgi:hypothetical protein